jgi:signal transduction histidine kinase
MYEKLLHWGFCPSNHNIALNDPDTGDIGGCYAGDAMKLKQVLINILGNSVKLIFEVLKKYCRFDLTTSNV